MEFGAALPADGESFELMKQGESLLNDVAELDHALDVRGCFAGDDGQDPAIYASHPGWGWSHILCLSVESPGVGGAGRDGLPLAGCRRPGRGCW